LISFLRYQNWYVGLDDVIVVDVFEKINLQYTCSAEPVWFAGLEILSQLQTFQKMVLFAFHNFERSFVDLSKKWRF
jgi:hypothetical protein